MKTFSELYKESQQNTIGQPEATSEPVRPDTSTEDTDTRVSNSDNKLGLLGALSVFGLTQMDELEGTEQQMIEYVSDRVSTSEQLKDIIDQLGVPPKGVSKLRQVYNHLRFQNDVKNSFSERREQNIERDTAESSGGGIKVTIGL